MESFVLKGFETRHLNITNNVSFETELPVDCSKVIWFTITAIFSFPRRDLPCIPGVPLNIAVSPSRRQPPYHMISFVSEGSETMYLTILNHISFEAELHVDCSKDFWNMINAGLTLLPDDVCHRFRCQNTVHGVLLPVGRLVLKGSEYKPFNVINHLSCYADLHIDCSKADKIQCQSLNSPDHFNVYDKATVH